MFKQNLRPRDCWKGVGIAVKNISILAENESICLIREIIQELKGMSQEDIQDIRYLWKEAMVQRGTNKNIEILIDAVCDRVLEN